VIYLEHEEFCRRYWDLRERVRSDPEYARLTRELEEMESRYEEVLSSLHEEDRLTIERYLLLRENRNLRLAEYIIATTP
jgi:hypothetical protein